MMPFPTTCKASILLAIGLTTICQALWAHDKTVQIKVPEGYDEITYDASRVNRRDLDRWLTLSPILSQNNNYLVPQYPLMCDSEDPTYVGCGREQVLLNRNNAKRNQDKIRDHLEHLNTKAFPPEFEPVILYFRAVQSFGLWKNQQQIDYAESRDIENVERSYAPLGLDPKISCSDVLRQIRASSDPLSTWKLVVHDWHNCTWGEAVKVIGEYPQQAWDAALKHFGIREHLVVQEEN